MRNIHVYEYIDIDAVFSCCILFFTGQYGTAAMTYFRFIKWLMFLNIYIMIIMFCVITVPYLALGPYTFNSSLTDANVSGYREAIECTTQYEIYHSNLTETESIGQQVLDLLQGTVSSPRSIIILDLSPFEKISNQPFNTSQYIVFESKIKYFFFKYFSKCW